MASSSPAPRSASWYGTVALALTLLGPIAGALLLFLGRPLCSGLFGIGCQIVMLALGYVTALASTSLGVVFAGLGLRIAEPGRPRLLCRVALGVSALSLVGMILWPLLSSSDPT